MNDQELLQQFVRDRSEPAFRALVERHSNWLYSVCLRRLRDPALAEDATQAVFLALAQKAPSLLREPTLSPWLHRAAKFVAANILRAQARRARHESEAAAMNPISSPPPQWHKIEPDLEPALDRLPFADRQIILLRFYEQKSNPEIAAILAISEPAAAKRLSRALERLRSILSPNSTSLSATTLTSLLLSYTVTLAPSHLAAVAAVSTTTAALAKGALTAMAFAKLQTAALVIAAACLLIAIPTTIIVLKHYDSPSPPPLADATSAPAPLDDFTQIYGLAPGQFIKLVTDGPPELRAEFMQVAHFRQDSPAGGTIFVGWENGSVRNYGHITSKRYPLSTLATNILDAQPFNIEGDLASQIITGDFSYDQTPTVTLDQRAADLQKILNEQLHIPARIQFRDVPRKILILRGKWKYTTDPNAPITNTAKASDGSPLPSINFYNTEKLDENSRQSGIGAGSHSQVITQLSIWLNQPVFLEAEDLPPAIGLRFFNPNGEHFDRNLLLKHVTEQTALTWSEENRTVRRLFIEPAPAPLDAFTQTYGLAPGEILKYVPEAPADLRDSFFRSKYPLKSPTPGALFIGWDGNTAVQYASGDQRYTLAFLARLLLDVYPEEIEGRLARRNITGDFSYSAGPGITPDQRCAALQKILQDTLSLPATIQFRDVSRKVIVLRGKWKLTPVPNIPTANAPTGPDGLVIPCIDIYGGDQFDQNSVTSGSGSGDARFIASELAYWMNQNQQIVIEADGFPKLLGFRTHNPPGELANAKTPSHNRDQVLDHIAEQSGLTWSEETRTVRRLFIESAAAP